MHLVVFSHKPCWLAVGSSSTYASDGGFPFQMQALSQLFDSTTLVLPAEPQAGHSGEIPLTGDQLKVTPLTYLAGKGLWRKARFPFWVLRNLFTLIQEANQADAIHAPIPGDIGTIGILLALAFRKPLLVRHCGNWLAPRTTAEKLWQWLMEYLAGGHNVMLATGWQPTPPSTKNEQLHWIFASSLFQAEIKQYSTSRDTRELTLCPRLIIVCRQEEDKGTGVVIDSLAQLEPFFPDMTLDIVGDGSALPLFQKKVEALGLTKRVHFHGKVTHERVIELLKTADLFCYPTMASEGFPKVVLEAMACGLPIITTSVSVLPHLIGEQCGVILKESSPHAVAAAVSACLTNQSLYTAMSAKAQEIVQNYSLEAWRDQIGQHLQSAWGLPIRRG